MADEQTNAPGTVSLREKKVVLGAADGFPKQTFLFLPHNLVVHVTGDGAEHGYRWKCRGYRVSWSEIAGAFDEPAVKGAMAERLDLAYRMMNEEKNRVALEGLKHNRTLQKLRRKKR